MTEQGFHIDLRVDDEHIVESSGCGFDERGVGGRIEVELQGALDVLVVLLLIGVFGLRCRICVRGIRCWFEHR